MAKAKTTRRKRRAATPARTRLSEEKRFQAEQDLRTLQTAEAIKASPARLAAARRMAREQVAALKKVAPR